MLTFRPLVSSDAPWCYRVAVLNTPSWLRVCQAGLPKPPEFEALLWRDVREQWAIMDGDVVIGCSAIFSVLPAVGIGWADVTFAGIAPPEPLALAAHDHLLSYAQTSGLRRLHLKHVSWRPPEIDERRWVVARTAKLPAAILHDGLYWDVAVSTVDLRRQT